MSTATISVLPVSLSLVHIPRSRLPALFHPVLKQILLPHQTFLNLTCNRVELSVFADARLLETFAPIAVADSRRPRGSQGFEPVEISAQKWSVLQIDSHSDQLDSSGARVHELSAPLADAGISILYQSSYTSDFIFVKEFRLAEAISLFSAAGFGLYSPDPNIPPLDEPRSPLHDSIVFSTTPSVLTRSRSSTDALTAGDQPDPEIEPAGADPPPDDLAPTPTASSKKSHSPSAGDVALLGSDLICVGLADEHAEQWSLKIVKLVAFPELIPSHRRPHPQSLATPDDPSAHLALSGLGTEPPDSDSDDSSSDFEDAQTGDEDDEDYLSESATLNQPSSAASSRHNSLTSETSSSFSAKRKIRSLAPLSPIADKTPTPTGAGDDGPMFETMHTPLDSTGTQGDAEAHLCAPEQHHVPFFSFTRTPEGTSLTTDVGLLAALFPPAERHMVVCGGELEAYDAGLLEESVGSDEEGRFGDGEEGQGKEGGSSGLLRCLQIDLRGVGLDKHGLVNRFSRILDRAGINHMYSSTFKTANLLVDKKQALRAQALLRGC